MVYILERLAVGNARDGAAPHIDIPYVLCVAEELTPPVFPELETHCVPVVDLQPIPPFQLEEAVRWIAGHIPKGKVLVHCNAGLGRSPSVVIAYLYCYEDFNFEKAVEFVAERKPDISPLPDLFLSCQEVKRRLASSGS
ncbi:dual specificity protein phosphatase family protein [bacterium]|nr:dual specificity protein phosphatase family protein [bacterium]